MSVIEIPNPSAKDLRSFGFIAAGLLALAGGVLAWHGLAMVARIAWLGSVLFLLLYYSLTPLRRPAYFLWMGLFFPLGWLLSHLLFAFIYYCVITPIGLALRATGRDALGLRFDPKAETYWHRRRPTDDPERYFRQY